MHACVGASLCEWEGLIVARPAGAVSIDQMVEGLKRLGFDAVFDTNFGADLTVRVCPSSISCLLLLAPDTRVHVCVCVFFSL